MFTIIRRVGFLLLFAVAMVGVILMLYPGMQCIGDQLSPRPEFCPVILSTDAWATILGGLLVTFIGAIAASAYWENAAVAKTSNQISAQKSRFEARTKFRDDAYQMEDNARAILDACRLARIDAGRIHNGIFNWQKQSRERTGGALLQLTKGRMDLWRMTAHAAIRFAALPSTRRGICNDLDLALTDLISTFDGVEIGFFVSTTNGLNDDNRIEEVTADSAVKHAQNLFQACEDAEPLAKRHLDACHKARITADQNYDHALDALTNLVE